MATKTKLSPEFDIPKNDLIKMRDELEAELEGTSLENDEDYTEENIVNEEKIEEHKKEENVVETKKSTSKPKNEPKKQQKKNPLDIIDNFKVDLNNIIINDEKDMIDTVEDFQFVLNNRPTYQVVLNQSCYIAHMQGLRLADINMLNNSSGGTFENQQRVYQVLHKLMNTTSIGKFDFKTFLNITSYFDLPTLYFGTYIETFPGSTEFTVTCGHCNQKIDVKIDNESFISVKDEDAYAHMLDIIHSVRNPKEALAKSLVNKFERCMLPDSKIIIEIQTPSLNDHLNLLSSIKEERLEEMKSMILILMFVKKLYFPDIKKISETGKPVYFTVNSRERIYQILRDLAPTDITTLGKSIDKYVTKYAIEYKIKSFKCTNCGEEVGDIPIDIENLLFQEVLQI